MVTLGGILVTLGGILVTLGVSLVAPGGILVSALWHLVVKCMGQILRQISCRVGRTL